MSNLTAIDLLIHPDGGHDRARAHGRRAERGLICWAFPEPTRGLEPRTPSLRVSAEAPMLAFLSHILGPEVCSNRLRFAEFGTCFGTRFPSSIRASP